MEINTQHYIAKCLPEQIGEAERYISDIEKVWNIMVDIFGKEPMIKKYIVDFTLDKGVCYAGSGKIIIYKHELDNLLPYPNNLMQGLVFETFHGFLEHVKHRPNGYGVTPYYGENQLGESFSTILKIELLDRLGLKEEANKFRKGKGMGKSHHQLLFLLVELHEEYGIGLFQKLFRVLENEEKPIITKELPKDELCRCLSECAKEDLSSRFTKHEYHINSPIILSG